MRGNGAPVFSPTPFKTGEPSHPLLKREEWRPAATGALLQGFCHWRGGRHHQSSCPRSWHSGWDQGLGHQDRAPWRLSTFPCCSELKMSPWEPTSSQGEEAGRGGQGGWWAQGQLTGLQRPRVTSRQRGRVGHQGRERHTNRALQRDKDRNAHKDAQNLRRPD